MTLDNLHRRADKLMRVIEQRHQSSQVVIITHWGNEPLPELGLHVKHIITSWGTLKVTREGEEDEA